MFVSGSVFTVTSPSSVASFMILPKELSSIVPVTETVPEVSFEASSEAVDPVSVIPLLSALLTCINTAKMAVNNNSKTAGNRMCRIFASFVFRFMLCLFSESVGTGSLSRESTGTGSLSHYRLLLILSQILCMITAPNAVNAVIAANIKIPVVKVEKGNLGLISVNASNTTPWARYIS